MFGEVEVETDYVLDYETLFKNRVNYLRDLAVKNHYDDTNFVLHVAFSCEAELDATQHFCEHFDEIMRNYRS